MALVMTTVASEIKNAPAPETESAVLAVMREQCESWVNSFRTARAASTITLGFFCGDALSLSRALHPLALPGVLLNRIHVFQWDISSGICSVSNWVALQLIIFFCYSELNIFHPRPSNSRQREETILTNHPPFELCHSMCSR